MRCGIDRYDLIRQAGLNDWVIIEKNVEGIQSIYVGEEKWVANFPSYSLL